MPSEFPAPDAIAPTCAAERILAATSDLCTLAGVKHTTMSDIARRAEVAEDVVCRQWASVTDIVSAVVIRDFHAGIEETEARIRSANRLEDLIAEAFASVYWFLDSHPIVGGAVRSDADTMLPTAPVSITTAIASLARWLVGAVGAAVQRALDQVVDADVLEEVTTRLLQSMLLIPSMSLPTKTFGDAALYARRRFVPLVYAMCQPDPGQSAKYVSPFDD
jgi:AcrR family transcriptional regulator